MPSVSLSAHGVTHHEAILLNSPFSHVESFSVIARRAVDVETLVQRTLSMASTSPSHLGEQTAAIVADMREEVVETSALVAWRSGFQPPSSRAASPD